MYFAVWGLYIRIPSKIVVCRAMLLYAGIVPIYIGTHTNNTRRHNSTRNCCDVPYYYYTKTERREKITFFREKTGVSEG